MATTELADIPIWFSDQIEDQETMKVNLLGWLNNYEYKHYRIIPKRGDMVWAMIEPVIENGPPAVIYGQVLRIEEDDTPDNPNICIRASAWAGCVSAHHGLDWDGQECYVAAHEIYEIIS